MCACVHGLRVIHMFFLVCDTECEKDTFFTFMPQRPRLFTGVSAFCVLWCELVQSKPLCVYVLHFHTYTLPTGMCGRRAALWLTWARLLACGWIPMGPCTSLKHGRVTSEHTPAGWPQWVAMTPVAPISESGLHVFLPCLILLYFFPSNLCQSKTWWMDIFSTAVVYHCSPV